MAQQLGVHAAIADESCFFPAYDKNQNCMEFQMTVSRHVGAGTRTKGVCRAACTLSC